MAPRLEPPLKKVTCVESHCSPVRRPLQANCVGQIRFIAPGVAPVHYFQRGRAAVKAFYGGQAAVDSAYSRAFGRNCPEAFYRQGTDAAQRGETCTYCNARVTSSKNWFRTSRQAGAVESTTSAYNFDVEVLFLQLSSAHAHVMFLHL